MNIFSKNGGKLSALSSYKENIQLIRMIGNEFVLGNGIEISLMIGREFGKKWNIIIHHLIFVIIRFN